MVAKALILPTSHNDSTGNLARGYRNNLQYHHHMSYAAATHPHIQDNSVVTARTQTSPAGPLPPPSVPAIQGSMHCTLNILC